MHQRTCRARERHVRSINLADDDWMNGGADNNHLTTILVVIPFQ